MASASRLRSIGSATTGVSSATVRFVRGPYSATRPQNSWPSTTGWATRPKRS
ncbi:unannotated protein [freshwater metagenome]|uniref:Unannotated protein n=1 Tax=freshwater metagenome TaxID=449393 RepID=A0A6J7JN35_9ZZZZ